MGYQKQTWTVYDEAIPDIRQPNSFITKAKLDHIELGLESAITDLRLGEVNEGITPSIQIVTDENDSSVKLLNFSYKHSAEWFYSSKELVDKATAPVGCVPGDMILDVKANIFKVIVDDNGEYKLSLSVNIKGNVGASGPAGPEGLPGKDGLDGKDGVDGTKWIWGDDNFVEGESAPKDASVGDFVLDTKGDVYRVQQNGTLHKLITLKGNDGKDATNDFTLEIGEVTIGDTASAEIVDGNTLNLTIPKGDTGAAGLPGADGKDGAPGSKGEKGDTGKDGADGIGIENITSELDSDGKTIVFKFELSDGSTKTTAVTLP